MSSRHPFAPGKNQSLEPSRDPTQGHRGLGENVWQPVGITVLGTPIGSEQHEKMEERIMKERALWEAIPTVPNLQCAWQIFQSANPRANRTMRTMPRGSSASYCQTHDEGIWATAKVLLDKLPADETTETESHQLATLPMWMGGLGLRSVVRCAPSAYWASWADALHMISERTPEVASEVVRRLGQEELVEGCSSLSWTRRGSGGDRFGLSCTRADVTAE